VILLPNPVFRFEIPCVLAQPGPRITSKKFQTSKLQQHQAPHTTTTMICRSCLRRSSALRFPVRQFSSTSFPQSPSTTTSSTLDADPALHRTPNTAGAAFTQPFSNPLSPLSKTTLKAKTVPLPISVAPAGTPLKGLNYLKDRADPIALPEEEYPEWLWRVLDKNTSEGGQIDGAGDEFSKSKKLRQRAAKRARKLEAKLTAAGDMTIFEPKIPVTAQSVDLPANEDGTVEGALEAGRVRGELRQQMRRQRRSGIKEGNFLKGM